MTQNPLKRYTYRDPQNRTNFLIHLTLFIFFSSVPDMYSEKLAQNAILTPEEASEIRTQYMKYLNEELLLAPKYQPEASYFQKQWKHITTASNDYLTYWDTGLDYGLLSYIGQQSVNYPEDFVSIHHDALWISDRDNNLIIF